MKICKILISILVLSSFLRISNLAFAQSSTYLPEDMGFELDWTFTETPPKRPQPKILNPENYEVKWKIDNPLMFGLVQDATGILYTSDSKNVVRAVFPNGKEKWNIHLDMGIKNSVIYLVVGQDGTIYAHSSDHYTENGLSSIYALTPEGKVKWKLQSSDIYSDFDSQFAGDARGNLIYFSNEGLVSRNSNGDVNWVNKSITSSKPNDISHTSHSVSIYLDSHSNIYVDSAFGEVISIDSTGIERWRTKPLPFVTKHLGFHPYFSDQGLLYILIENGLHALNGQNGSIVDLSKNIDLMDVKSAGVPFDGEGGYYFINWEGFRKITSSGAKIWEYKLRDSEKNGLGFFREPVTDKAGNVYFSTDAGNIIALNSSGEEIFVFLRNGFWSKITNVLIGANGNIYSTNHDIGLVSFGKKQIQVYKDNISLPVTSDPINVEGTVLVPFRSLFESFGLKVEWDQISKTVTGSKEGLTIQLIIGEMTAYVNGQPQKLDVAPLINDDSTYVPLRFIGESIGKKVSWNGENSSINIDQ
ncbi:stalk domain-containing protein [Paenibacillus contaminans]|uniref:Copper amine oxidase-like N-terminal domain-containing protein n=1 Tax=Paenibacillus contaminans TaxID=450362 RepID=A0A329MNT8_9BACL|nr:stalk domain-containing protein [Paenibacillus contaminans]RAV21559.1 hypothetical protein DQG23_09850 [Paenibacillus contaminans]